MKAQLIVVSALAVGVGGLVGLRLGTLHGLPGAMEGNTTMTGASVTVVATRRLEFPSKTNQLTLVRRSPVVDCGYGAGIIAPRRAHPDLSTLGLGSRHHPGAFEWRRERPRPYNAG